MAYDDSRRVPLPGSDREHPPSGHRVGPVPATEQVRVSVVLRRRGDAPDPTTARVDRAAFAATYGADPDDVARVETFARDHGLAVVEVDVARRTVVLGGDVATATAAFGVDLGRYEHPSEQQVGPVRGRTGSVHVPAELADVVTAVLGLDNRPQARAHFRIASTGMRPAAGSQPDAFTAPELGDIYDFPPPADGGLPGAGQTIAILELGGGYRQDDLDTYFGALGLAVPAVDAVGVDGGSNAPSGDPNSADGEVLLDIEVAGALAPGAAIAVYFAPNTDRGFLDALTTAVHDDQRRPSVVSISWGGPESSWTTQAMQAFDAACADAAALGVTVCCACGDSGSSDGVSDGGPHVDFPAASPHVLACGGTRVVTSAGAVVETVWNDGPGQGATGGGVSAQFPLPDWQRAITIGTAGPPAGRGVPDVAGDADPQTGYRVRVDGQDIVIGGTSAVAPLWAALVARLNAGRAQPLGFLNPLLYAVPPASDAFRDVTVGDNGDYSAGPGWDACTGWGAPLGRALATALAAPPTG